MQLNKVIYGLSLFLLGGLVLTGCKKDEPEDPADAIASFQFEISDAKWAEVIFTNYSQNATSYAWDFGDGNTSTEESPTHVYAGGGTYEVTLTASGATGSATRTEMARPIHSTSWRSSMAFFSSSALPRSTKAKPRLRPVSRSRGIEHLLTSPYWLNKWMRSSLSASQERLPMKIVKKLIQKG